MSTESTMTPVTSTFDSGCPKCGTNKSGKSSCCGSGGAWFGNCGNKGDPKFDHTWGEGVRTCQTVTVAKAQSKQSPAVWDKETGLQKMSAPDRDTLSNVNGEGYINSQVFVKLTDLVFFITVLLTLLVN